MLIGLFGASYFYVRNYIRYGIDRVEAEHNMMNRYFTVGTAEFEASTVDYSSETTDSGRERSGSVDSITSIQLKVSYCKFKCGLF